MGHGDIKKAGINFGITTIPTPPGASGRWSPFVGVQGVVINAYSKNRVAASMLARSLATSASQVSFARAGGRIPVSFAAWTTLKADPVISGFSKAISVGTPMPNVPQMGAVWEPWGNAVAQSVQKASPNYKTIHDVALKEITSSIK
ncbi:hypothetical protein GCM10008955_10370 [Deinococcus malanensis]|uniref:Extracellular solute-binding protein n=1 Tax=Deinococcus malanensis TaxID=1706855 RepID=A0ABQ2ENK9_9DEIO|nr:hypothetical protein GCM10008955_10370 [Deinococcus malanensis]